FRISDMGTNGDPFSAAYRPDVTFNSANDESLIVWEGNDGVDGSDTFEIYGQRLLGATGAETGDSDFRISDMGPDGDNNFDAGDPAVAYNEATNRYVVVWAGDNNVGDLDDNEFEIFGQRLDARPDTFGKIEPNDCRISSMGPNGDTKFAANSPAIVSSQTEFLAIWSGDTNTPPLVDDEFEIFGRLFAFDLRARAVYDAVTRSLVIYGSSLD